MCFQEAKGTQAYWIFPNLGSRTLQDLGTKTFAVNIKQGFLVAQNWLIHIWHNAKIQNTFTLY